MPFSAPRTSTAGVSKPIVASTTGPPLVGAVEARGLTTAQLSSAIAGRLKSGSVRDPSVAVEIETYRPFFVLGEATFPGQYPTCRT